MSSAKLRSIELTIDSFMSLIKIMKRIGPRTVPWGTPLITLDTDDFTLDVLYVCDVIIKINVRYVIINRFLRYIQ